MFAACLAVAVLFALVLDVRAAPQPLRAGEPGGRAAMLTTVALVATVIAALVPIGALLPQPSLAHVAPVPSWDVVHPCVAPPEPPSRAHGIAPLAVLKLLFPVIVAAALGAAARPVIRPRRLLAAAFGVACVVTLIGSVRALRGGADVASIRACGALTPEEGAEGASVRGVVQRMITDARQEVIRWRDLPRLPRPPWVRSEIPVTIGGEPWVLRVRASGVVAEPDDLRRIERPLPALHFASVPILAHGADAKGRAATVLLDHRPGGKLYAVRVGRPVSASEIGPLLRAPRWPLAMMLGVLGASAVTLWMLREKDRAFPAPPPYRTASVDPSVPLATAVPAIIVLVLIEASATALQALTPYL